MRACITTLLIWAIPAVAFTPSFNTRRNTGSLASSEWKSDFDDFIGGDGDGNGEESMFFSEELLTAQTKTMEDLSGCQSRQFSLGQDLVLSDFAGSMGFDEVTDWEYYYEEDDGPGRKVVNPNPLDPAQPRRTRASSGSVVRIFRGEFVGRLAGNIRSKGLDKRVLVKEFSGKLALDLARAELTSLGKLQSDLAAKISSAAKDGEWLKTATSRSINSRQDDLNLCSMIKEIGRTPFVGILGEVNLAELEDEMDPNEFYRALGVVPPKPGAVWIVYEYAGLTSLELYCQPAEIRRSRVPPQRGFFGVSQPPPIPSWSDRSRYVKCIMKQSLEAVALVHESGISHRSIGRSSLIMGATAQDKTQASSVYTISPSQVFMKLADYGFSGLEELATYDKEFLRRAKTFGLSFQEGRMTNEVAAFCQAEDLHALGLVFVALLLTSLAEVDPAKPNLPATDEETLQRLLTDIFEKDILQFREYVEAEEIWDNVVEMLDATRGWELLEFLCFAREKVKDGSAKTAKELLSVRFFQSI